MFGLGNGAKNLQKSIDSLVGDVGRLQRSVEHLTQIMGRIVFPAAAMSELTGELRAIRQLMDREGRFTFIDREREAAREKIDLDRAEAEIRDGLDRVAKGES